ncbi:myelin-associated neurite-outgrowth inhibitor-like isoform X2 [Scleropages formosus]|uniref:Family with sequence similarity 168 member B n=3 Tax=Scleropages formosus TaxID=113540 RepID=A0A8C9RY91_SCLFO|nr:myelin-associated neurite-outgrowth inhibitor-like isoform X2 [Scleropages formosus]
MRSSLGSSREDEEKSPTFPGSTKRYCCIMNPIYSPAPAGASYANAKGIGYPAGFPVGYAAALPYTPSIYPGTNPGFTTGYASGAPYKMSCSPTTGAVPPYSSSSNPYQTAVYPVRSSYPQQNPYAQQQGTYFTQPVYAAPPHVIHHTTVVQPNGMPAAMYAPPIAPGRGNNVAMGMVTGATMAMSAGTLLTAPSPTPVTPHPVTIPPYRPAGTPTYSYVPPSMVNSWQC